MSEQQWAWMFYGSDTANGPFGSIEEAIEDAHSNDAEGHVRLGTCRWASLADFLSALDCERIDEAANEIAWDNDFAWYEDDVFDLKIPPCTMHKVWGLPPEEKALRLTARQEALALANEELRAAVRPWAEKWVVVSGIFTFQEKHTINLHEDGTWTVYR